VVIAIIALLISILLPALAEARKAAKLAKGLSNLHQLAVSTHSYTTDFQDRLWAFTWRASGPNGRNYQTQYADLQTPGGDDMRAARFQMVDIIRRRGDRPTFPSLSATALFPHLTYSHLVLLDYLNFELPNLVTISPEDRDRLKWAADPAGYDAGLYQPNLGTGGDNQRHPYGSSYRIVPAAVDISAVGSRMQPYPANHNSVLYYPGNTKLEGRRMSDISYPGQKVHMYDTMGRHFGKFNWSQAYCFEQCRQPLALLDASAAVRANRDANQGCANPNNPSEPITVHASLTYVPSPIEPPAPSPNTPGTGYYMWTRGGMKGVDFAGKEVRTGGY
jgi:hypothetical protein